MSSSCVEAEHRPANNYASVKTENHSNHNEVTMDTGSHGNGSMAIATSRNESYSPYGPTSMGLAHERLNPPHPPNSSTNHLDHMGAIVSMATAMSPSVAMPTADSDFHVAANNIPDDAINGDDVSMGKNQSLAERPSGGKAGNGGSGGTANVKDVTVEQLEFDGNTVLCRVCGDKASGFHYGVHACEGCKGFFRRSIQQKIQYRPCLKNQMCNIMRVNRNRCQYCRLRKCIAVGMSRDAVRFGRVPKREKAKIMEQMQRVNAQLQGNMLNDVLDNPKDVIQHIIGAHVQTCEFTRSKFITLFEKAWERPQFVDCPAHMACPLSPSPDQCENIQKWDEFSSCFTPAIRSVVNFAKSIPGFAVFSQEDQVTLLKAGTFEVLLVHLACLFDTRTNTMMFTNGKLYRKLPQQGTTNAGFLLDSMFDFADRLNQLRLTDEELALFSAMVIVAHDRPGLRYQDQVQRVHDLISQGLQAMIKTNHPSEPAVFSKLLMKIPDLRTLNTLHSEKLLGLTVPQSSGGSSKTCDTVTNTPPVLTPGVSQSSSQPSRENCPISVSKPGLMPPGYRSCISPASHAQPASFPSSFSATAAAAAAAAMLRCPMQMETTPCAISGQQTEGSNRPPGQPIIPHLVSQPENPQNELILETPIGSFHRCAPSYAHGLSAMIKMETERNNGKIQGPHQQDPLLMVAGKQQEAANSDLLSNRGSHDYNKQRNMPPSTYNNGQNNQDKVTSMSKTPGSPPEDFIDVDLQGPKGNHNMRFLQQSGKNGTAMGQVDMRRVMTDPMVPEMFRKRLLEGLDCEIDPKIARLWDYDMRSSRSNSLSSSSSHESTDSAYKTISNPATPRSAYELSRSPYTSPGEIPIRHPLHQSTPMSLPKVTEESHAKGQRSSSFSEEEEATVCENNPLKSQMFLPTLRNMLIAGRQSHGGDRSDSSPTQEHSQGASEDSPGPSSSQTQSDRSESPESDHYWMHKKLKLKQCLSERNTPDYQSSLPPVRERAASFSTAVSRLHQKMAPPMLKPISREAPPRLTTKPSSTAASATEGCPTFGSIMSKVMEAALMSEQLEETTTTSQSSSKEESRSSSSPSQQTDSESVSDSTNADNNHRSPHSSQISSPPAVPELSTTNDDTTDRQTARSITHSPHADGAGDKNNATPEPTKSDRDMAASPHHPTEMSGATPGSSKGVSRPGPATNPAQRHPELLSRLNSGPRVPNGSKPPLTLLTPGKPAESSHRPRVTTPPPSLYPIMDPHHSPHSSVVPGSGRPQTSASAGLDNYSPPPLLPMQHMAGNGKLPGAMDQAANGHGSSNHLNTISSLKDKILKRIDSQENLVRMCPNQSVWSANQQQQTPACHEPVSSTTNANHLAHRKRKYPQDRDSPNLPPTSSGPGLLSMKQFGQGCPPPPPPPGCPPQSLAMAAVLNQANSMGGGSTGAGQFPPGPNPGQMPVNMHPALMYNVAAVQQYQALQQLHLQAAHLQRLQHMSSTANGKLSMPRGNGDPGLSNKVSDSGNGSPIQRSGSAGALHGTDNGSLPYTGKHSMMANAANMSQGDTQPINLTKHQQQSLALSAGIKSEPM